ncbi:MAG: PilZ domain-containing protein, partial [Sphingomonadales bacterium]|nr:PilZ domain-containing protein [Sphingomonadales bacterium]
MGFAVEMTEESGRAAERATIRLRTGFRRRGDHRTYADVLDLSTHGFRVQAPIALAKGTHVWLNLPGLEAKSARVVWSDGSQAGCEFETPFHPSVFERIVRMNGGEFG